MTFVIKTRGSANRITTSDYECAEHGRFDLVVERDDAGDIPELAPCDICEAPSERRFGAPPVHTQFVVSATQGKSDPRPHPNAMNTMALGEGQSQNEWRKERKKVWEAERKKRVMAYDG
ncbi:MAG TPA: hypothetical protein VGM39_08660 [Kofleriaceae bacterium]